MGKKQWTKSHMRRRRRRAQTVRKVL